MDREKELLKLFCVLPEGEQKEILYEVKKRVIAYEADYTKMTAEEKRNLGQAKLHATRPSEITDWEDVDPSEQE
jgi:hypothetical protein